MFENDYQEGHNFPGHGRGEWHAGLYFLTLGADVISRVGLRLSTGLIGLAILGNGIRRIVSESERTDLCICLFNPSAMLRDRMSFHDVDKPLFRPDLGDSLAPGIHVKR